jgi:hypothetical protein
MANTLKIDFSGRAARPKWDAQGTWVFAVMDRKTFITHTIELTGSYGDAVSQLPSLLSERGIVSGTAQITLQAPPSVTHHRRKVR